MIDLLVIFGDDRDSHGLFVLSCESAWNDDCVSLQESVLSNMVTSPRYCLILGWARHVDSDCAFREGILQ